MHLMSTAFSSTEWACIGLFSLEHTLHSQSYKSCRSSRPTMSELARLILSEYGREKAMATRERMIKFFIIILSINSKFDLFYHDINGITFSQIIIKRGEIKKWRVRSWGNLDFQNGSLTSNRSTTCTIWSTSCVKGSANSKNSNSKINSKSFIVKLKEASISMLSARNAHPNWLTRGSTSEKPSTFMDWKCSTRHINMLFTEINNSNNYMIFSKIIIKMKTWRTLSSSSWHKPNSEMAFLKANIEKFFRRSENQVLLNLL